MLFEQNSLNNEVNLYCTTIKRKIIGINILKFFLWSFLRWVPLTTSSVTTSTRPGTNNFISRTRKRSSRMSTAHLLTRRREWCYRGGGRCCPGDGAVGGGTVHNRK